MEFVTGFRGARRTGQRPCTHIHAGLLADTRNPEHLAALQKLKIEPFDLVVVNLYPFSETVDWRRDRRVRRTDRTSAVRRWCAAAKNHASVAVVVEPLGYDGVLAAVRAGGFTLGERKELASLAFRHTAEYDIAVASWTESTLAPGAETPAALRGGSAGTGGAPRCCVTARTRISGQPSTAMTSAGRAWLKPSSCTEKMSYNNFTDADAAWRAAFDHSEICVAIIKHANPCGIAISRSRWPTRTARRTPAIR